MTGPDGRFTFDDVVRDRARSSSGPAGSPRSSRPLTGRRHRDRPVAGRAARDRHGHAQRAPSSGWARRPASVNVLEREQIERVAGASSPTTCCVGFRRSACSAARAACRRIRRRRACRCAASGRAASAARSCCSTACRSTIRSAGWVYWTRVPMESADRIEVVDGATLEPVRQLRDGRRHQHRRAAGRRGGLSKFGAQYGNLNSPKFDFFGSDVWGRLGVARRRQRLRHGRLSDRRRTERSSGQGGHQGRPWTSGNFNVKVDYALTDRVNLFVRGGYFGEDRDNAKVIDLQRRSGGQRHQLEVRQRRRARRPAGRQRAPGARVRRLRDVPQQLPRGAGGRRPPRSIGRMTLNQQRADRRRRRRWRSGRRRSAASHYFIGRHRLALGGRRQQRGCARRRRRGRR